MARDIDLEKAVGCVMEKMAAPLTTVFNLARGAMRPASRAASSAVRQVSGRAARPVMRQAPRRIETTPIQLTGPGGTFVPKRVPRPTNASVPHGYSDEYARVLPAAPRQVPAQPLHLPGPVAAPSAGAGQLPPPRFGGMGAYSTSWDPRMSASAGHLHFGTPTTTNMSYTFGARPPAGPVAPGTRPALPPAQRPALPYAPQPAPQQAVAPAAQQPTARHGNIFSRHPFVTGMLAGAPVGIGLRGTWPEQE